jgi:branched-chain amino acid transport system substrate-binding protein
LPSLPKSVSVPKSVRLGLSLTALATGLAGCAGSGRSASTGSTGPITIGALYPLSGPQGGGGTSEERGAALAAQWVDQHGGVGGRPIVLDPVDAPTADAVPSAIAQLQAKHIRIIVGTHGSTLSAVAAQVAQSQHLLLWETGAVGNLDMSDDSSQSIDTYDWSNPTGPAPVDGMGRSFFRMSPQGASLGRAGIEFVIKQLAPKLPGQPKLRIAVAYVTDSYGSSVAAGVVDQIHADGAVLAGTFPYPEYGANFTQLAQEIKRSGANALYASSYLADGEALRRATIAQNVPLVASVGTSSSYCLPAFGQDLQQAAVGLFASDKAAAYSINQNGLLPEGRQTLQWAEAQYAKQFGGEMDAYATSGFANAYALFEHVLPVAHSLTPAGVAEAASTVKLPVGSLADGSGMDFRATGAEAGENLAAASVIWEWVAPGKEAVVWPPSYATQSVSVLAPET